MPGRVGGELRHPGADRDAPHHLRPRPQTQRLRPVAARLRQEQRPPRPADSRPMRQVALQQHPGRCRIRHHPLEPILRRLRPHPQHPPARIQIVGAQRAQLLAPQRRVIGQREHHPVPWRLARRDRQDVAPLLLGRDPRQLHHPRHQAALLATPLSVRRVSAPPNRIRLPNTLLNQEIEEQPHRHQPLLNRGIRQPAPGIDRHHIRAATAGAARSAHERRPRHQPGLLPPPPFRSADPRIDGFNGICRANHSTNVGVELQERDKLWATRTPTV